MSIILDTLNRDRRTVDADLPVGASSIRLSLCYHVTDNNEVIIDDAWNRYRTCMVGVHNNNEIWGDLEQEIEEVLKETPDSDDASDYDGEGYNQAD